MCRIASGGDYTLALEVRHQHRGPRGGRGRCVAAMRGTSSVNRQRLTQTAHVAESSSLASRSNMEFGMGHQDEFEGTDITAALVADAFRPSSLATLAGHSTRHHRAAVGC